ncbi:ABC transporter ATP-binding protein [Candidatus Nitronereus thalassa]|uniref:ABC transporter ATP-binding protein n=1 Tax=Candidatus Nitronereus thalassa TaxID=3020898 RepID=A0ABU3K5D1_9BACT|nr:ABC transporter ATP-binding protein [Candidatus Nitronereus thalassa]MDT7041591.1 ABC transporter ATP-binding protein [Candidatus Nitronereus thalassa]
MTPKTSAHTLAQNLFRALRFVWDSGRGWTLASAALLVVQGLLPLAMLYLIKLVIDSVTANLSSSNPSAGLYEVIFLLSLLGVVAVASTACSILKSFVHTGQAQAVTDYMSSILHAKSVDVDLEYYEEPQYYNTLHRAQREASSRPTRILSALFDTGQNGISLIAIGALLFWFHWGILFVLIGTALPIVFVRLRYGKKLYAWQKGTTPAERESWYLNLMLTRDTHAKEIRLFDLGKLFIDRFRNLREGIRRERLSLEGRRSIAELVAHSSSVAAAIGVNIFFAYQTLLGFLTLGDLVMYFQAVQRGAGFLQSLMMNLAYLYESNLFLTHLYDFLDIQPKAVEPQRPQAIHRPLQQGIVFDHVKFDYPSGTRKVLEDISLTIRPGEHIALVGENGAGKTTLVKLLARLYDPSAGRITIDGVDLRDLKPAELRKEISVVFQDFAKYHFTARENIWLGNTLLPRDTDQVIDAARMAGIDSALRRLPKGYDTILGRWFEGGEELSIGEWQKIAIARAFLRDAQIVILDEPTSAMDAKAEYELFQHFHELTKGRTAILISHRLSTVKMVDRIYVLEDGRILESGHHNDLLERDGEYAKMFSLQAQYYR